MRFKLLLLIFPVLAHTVPGYFEPWGKDTDLKYSQVEPTQQTPPPHSLGVRIAEQVILFRQQVLSPVDGPRSHFRPSSSSYMLQAIHKYGFFKGYLMGCDRLMRENSDEWVYRKIVDDGKLFKHDPVR
jgi:hypothetical protein